MMMMDIYQLNFAGLLGLCAVLSLAGRKPAQSAGQRKQCKESSKVSQSPFLVVYSLVMGADWLQGPFLFSLYRDEHGVSSSLVSALFTAGFLSGAASGYFVGSVADRHGRKAACLFFCLAYSASCLLTMIPNVPLLFLGRALGGLSTSLLFSVFEGWMVTDFHNQALGEKGGDISRTFGLMSTLNSIMGILSGVLSEWLVSVTGTRKSPFAASIALLGLAFWVIWSQWDENYGDAAVKEKRPEKQPAEPRRLWSILTDSQVISLGLACTTFEGSMYLFVFFWTPALKSVHASSGGLPYGIIFASFMASILASSLAFNMAMERRLLKYSSLLLVIFGVAGLCFFLAARPGSEQSTFWIFCLFEAAVGLYWPCMGYLKGKLVDDGIRAQVYSILRIPLNVFVVMSLIFTGDGDSFGSVFSTCSTLLLASCGMLAIGFLNKEAP